MAADTGLAAGVDNATRNSISAVSFAILYYDFILTLPLEVERYWKSRFTWVSVLFFLNRYGSVLSHIPIIYEHFGDVSKSGCQALHTYHGVLAVASQGNTASLMIIRTYALYDCSLRVAMFLGAILTISGSVGLWAISVTVHNSYTAGTGSPHLYTGDHCTVVLSEAQAKYYAIAWSAILVFDFAVFCLTLAKALKWSIVWRHGFFYLIMRDGTMYFAILIVCYLTNVLTFLYGKPEFQSFLITLTNVLSATLVTRMMLNMRDQAQATATDSQILEGRMDDLRLADRTSSSRTMDV